MPSPARRSSSSSAARRRLHNLIDEHFKTPDDLPRAPALAAELERECGDLERGLRAIEESLSLAASAWLSRSDEVRGILRQLRPLLPPRPRGENAETQQARAERMLVVELPLLAKEVGRIETVRLYAATTLQLEALVGNLEDAAFAFLRQASINNKLSGSPSGQNPNDVGWKQEKLCLAINTMKDIEQELVRVSTSRPQWTNLVMAVDSRVEKTFAILRPQVLMDHRALLAVLGWPPSLLMSGSENGKPSEVPNPLIRMNGKKKEAYSQSFLALCALQHLQAQRGARHSLKDCKVPISSDGLWAVDELVRPVASRMEYHFSKWSSQPEFIFALVYKITNGFMDGVDNILQPLIDRARLAGFCAKEAWVAAMIKMLSGYLELQIFPALVSSYHVSDANLEVVFSWLHLLDLMITFDKRMHALATSGIRPLQSLAECEGSSMFLSILSLFNEHSDWLQVWAEIELRVARNKLKPKLEDEKSWLCSISQQCEDYCKEEADRFLLSGREDYKAPPIVDSVVKIASSMIECGRALPSKKMKTNFIRSSVAVFFSHFFVALVERCHEIELAAKIEDGDLLRVACSINAARYCESVIEEWNEDMTLVDMTANEGQNHDHHHPKSFFAGELVYLVKLRTDYLEDVMTGLLLEFEAVSWEYIQNTEQWEELKDWDEESSSVSFGFVEPLDTLSRQIGKLKLCLNFKDFINLWRSVAEGLDYFIYSSIPWSDVRFSNSGAIQFKADMRALFGVFGSLCARPEAFFPSLSEALKLLSMNGKDAARLIGGLKREDGRKEFMQLNGFYHVSDDQAEMILKNRNFGG